MSSIFEIKRTAKFHECDPAGIVFYAQFFTYTHDALEEFCKSKEIWNDWFNNAELAAPIVACSAEYKSPLKLGEDFKVVLISAEIGKSSVQLKFSVENQVSKKLCCSVQSTHVFINKRNGATSEVPSKIVRQINIK